VVLPVKSIVPAFLNGATVDSVIVTAATRPRCRSSWSGTELSPTPSSHRNGQGVVGSDRVEVQSPVRAALTAEAFP